ncbi:hypothetical protein AADZ90_010200 [Aestuariibius sp. 2305UL40-4]|uniref:hypothetical protein n=1 Tax=Aestuariibius violaceus TaxID=3234132 RepID=UPI003486F796
MRSLSTKMYRAVTILTALACFTVAASGQTSSPEKIFTSLEHRYVSGPPFTIGLDHAFFIDLTKNAPCNAQALADAITNDRGRASCEVNDSNCRHYWADAVVNACFFPMTPHHVCDDLNREEAKAEYELCVLNVIAREAYFAGGSLDGTEDGPRPFPTVRDFLNLAVETADILDASYPSEDDIRSMADLSLPDRGRLREAIVPVYDRFFRSESCRSEFHVLLVKVEVRSALCSYEGVQMQLRRIIRRAADIYSIID